MSRAVISPHRSANAAMFVHEGGTTERWRQPQPTLSSNRKVEFLLKSRRIVQASLLNSI
jgi:hypothetical protein